MGALDTAIQELHESYGWGGRQIASRLGEHVATVSKRMRRLGIQAAGVTNQYTVKGSALVLPFRLDRAPTGRSQTDMHGSQAMGQAIAWFLDHGYTPSIPFVPSAYDLVVESEEGLKRVQVKFTSSRNNTSPSFVAPIHHREHQAGGACRRNVPYTKADVDLFFIVTSDQEQYLIPIEAVEGKQFICLDLAYKDYRVG